jgi:hypothetical protein
MIRLCTEPRALPPSPLGQVDHQASLLPGSPRPPRLLRSAAAPARGSRGDRTSPRRCPSRPRRPRRPRRHGQLAGCRCTGCGKACGTRRTARSRRRACSGRSCRTYTRRRRNTPAADPRRASRSPPPRTARSAARTCSRCPPYLPDRRRGARCTSRRERQSLKGSTTAPSGQPAAPSPTAPPRRPPRLPRRRLRGTRRPRAHATEGPYRNTQQTGHFSSGGAGCGSLK